MLPGTPVFVSLSLSLALSAPQAVSDTRGGVHEEGWDTGFGQRGPDGRVTQVHVFDGRIVLHEVVDFGFAQSFSFVHQWDPRSGGIESAEVRYFPESPEVNDFLTYDGGSGEVLLVGGVFNFVQGGAGGILGLAQYASGSWSPFPLPPGQRIVHRLASNGPELFAWTSEDVPGAYDVSRWEGSSWESLGPPPGFPRDLEFSTAGGVGALYAIDATGLRRYSTANGVWEPVATPVTQPRTMVHYDPEVPLLVVGGEVDPLMAWNGATWSTLGGLPAPVGVTDLAVRERDGGDVLYACGSFESIGALPAARLALWTGASWQEVGGGLDATALSVAVDPPMRGVAVAGRFHEAGGLSAPEVAHWDRSGWHPFRDGEGLVRDGRSAAPSGIGEANVLEVLDTGAGPRLHVGGEFSFAGSSPKPGVAVWTGTRWAPLGEGFAASVTALEAFDDGAGPTLYAGLGFALPRLAAFDGTTWQGVPGLDGGVFALDVFDYGSGPALYAAGSFTTIAGVPAFHLARFDGTAWSALGGDPVDGRVSALAVHDDGTGPALYVGGDFSMIGGVTALGVARWDGATWSPVGEGLGVGPFQSLVGVFASVDLPSLGGVRLFAGGTFRETGNGTPAGGLAVWDGTAWSPLGTGLVPNFQGSLLVSGLTVFDEGAGPRLVAGGLFAVPSGLGENLARFDGAAWQPVPGPVPGLIRTLRTFEGDLWVGGRLSSVGGVESLGVARRFSVPSTRETGRRSR